MHEGWRVWRKPLIGRKIRLFKLNLPIIGGDTRHGCVTPFLPGLSPVQGKAVVASFDGGRLSWKADWWPCARSKVGWDWPTVWPRA